PDITPHSQRGTPSSTTNYATNKRYITTTSAALSPDPKSEEDQC
ncbi:hypothetical protein A2U01_0112630, partial [Trifolium medium]|nr:hypothetical protein [Trifolium medium]